MTALVSSEMGPSMQMICSLRRQEKILWILSPLKECSITIGIRLYDLQLVVEARDGFVISSPAHSFSLLALPQNRLRIAAPRTDVRVQGKEGQWVLILLADLWLFGVDTEDDCVMTISSMVIGSV